MERLAISRRFADGMRRIISLLPRIAQGRAGRFARTELFLPALTVATANAVAEGKPTDQLDKLKQAILRQPPPPPAPRRSQSHEGRGGGRHRQEKPLPPWG